MEDPVYHNATLELSHVTINIDKKVKHGLVKFILTANNGYSFYNYVTFIDSCGCTHVINNFKDSNTKCIFTHEVTGDITISATASKITNKLIYCTNIYSVNNNILEQLADVCLINSGINSVAVEYQDYISNLYTIPFIINDSLISDEVHIKLGQYDSLVNAYLLQDYIVIINMGNISVPEKYHNVYDYKDISCYLHLPYCETLKIESFYVVNHVLSIEYKINLYNAECTINISSDITGEIIESKTVNIGSQIPLIQNQTGNINNTLKPLLNNSINTPFIEVIRNVPYNINTIFGSETVDYGKLENYIGFIKVSEIMLNINATNEEKNEIISLLKNGVFINKKF